jgi:plasmid maintenance system killer protein
MPMELTFSSEELCKQCSKRSECLDVFGSGRATLVMRRLGQMRAAPNLKELLQLQGGHFLRLKGKHRTTFAAMITTHSKFIFEPACHPIPVLASGTVDCLHVTALRILRFEDNHGH